MLCVGVLLGVLCVVRAAPGVPRVARATCAVAAAAYSTHTHTTCMHEI